MLLAVDPGITECGCAIFLGDQLQAAQLVRSPAAVSAPLDLRVKCMAMAVQEAWDHLTDEHVSELAIEYPVAYSRKIFQKGDQNDLILVATVVGAILMRFGIPSQIYRPYEWKRELPKRVTKHRILKKRLNIAERARIILPAPSLQHNVYDAVGIGLHHVGRCLY